MKTTKTIAALSIMFFFAVVTAFSSNPAITKNPIGANMVRHIVMFPSFDDQHLCGAYLIEIRDQYNQLVAPSKAFIPGVSQYIFFERAFAGEGVRIAAIRPVTSIDPAQCSVQLYAEPVSIKGLFEAGKTYRFMLEPKVSAGKE